MQKEVSREEGRRYFQEFWESLGAGDEFFKCETHQSYAVAAEEEFFELFKMGKLEELRNRLSEDVSRHDSSWQDARRRGILYRRVRIFDEPLNDYTRFEIEAYKIQAAAVEDIRMVPSSVLSAQLKGEVRDFLLFGREKAILVRYQKDNQPVGATITDDIDDVRRLRSWRDELLRIAVPLEEFLSLYADA